MSYRDDGPTEMARPVPTNEQGPVPVQVEAYLPVALPLQLDDGEAWYPLPQSHHLLQA